LQGAKPPPRKLAVLTANADVLAGSRIAVLTWLATMLQGSHPAIQSEILRITETAELRDALEWIEASRVAVNLDGMKEAEELKFREAYLRFATYRELIPHISEIRLKPLGFAGETAVYSLPEKDFRLLISAEDGHARLLHIFSDAFQQMRDVFLNSPQFGLDACLSVRIRHGILAQHIRRPFSENRLFIDPSDSRAKDIIAYWIQAAELPSGSGEILLNILTVFSQSILDIIEEVKDTWIQVTTEFGNIKPIFNYAYNDQALEAAFNRSDFVTADYGQFLDGIFDELLDRTRMNLTGARKRIETDLDTKLVTTLIATEELLMTFSSASNYGLLRDAVSRCKSDVERSLQTMQRWFQGTDAALLEDVTFEMAANTAIGMANRLYPGIKQQIQDQVSSEFKLQGRYFSGFVHLLFFLIENAMSHSGLQLHEQAITVIIKAENNIIRIVITNKLAVHKDGSQCVQIVNQKIAEVRAKRDYSKVRSEGGSGLAKIIATLTLEFGSEKHEFCARIDGSNMIVMADFEASHIMK
jgi:hypothetical protein